MGWGCGVSVRNRDQGPAGRRSYFPKKRLAKANGPVTFGGEVCVFRLIGDGKQRSDEGKGLGMLAPRNIRGR